MVEIATDPYWPNVFVQKNLPYEQRIVYFMQWAHFIQNMARDAGKNCHMWHQTFGIPKAHEAMIMEFMQAARRIGIDSAVWGFMAASVFRTFQSRGMLNLNKPGSLSYGRWRKQR